MPPTAGTHQICLGLLIKYGVQSHRRRAGNANLGMQATFRKKDTIPSQGSLAEQEMTEKGLIYMVIRRDQLSNRWAGPRRAATAVGVRAARCHGQGLEVPDPGYRSAL
ncbi:hypothetical protein OOU_Y34scaffold00608g82 [Pyricularia oryzae Y34]|uniref:Uncharacterized protein n=2 Tax=Pyricularia oryzae TaxID=318829 RepID=A0AA97NVX5_PYRO3|nr:hypothetical protein OOU_Y34scaffold00608g82 [Pyricularia oryzae Y34]